jgi:hypothetical protein
MMRRWLATPALLALALVLAASLVAGGSRSLAQDASPAVEAGLDETTGLNPRPAHIHAGTCDELGEVVFPLNDLVAPDIAGSPVAEGENTDESTPADPLASPPVTADVGQLIEQSETTVEASLDDILADEHAINVHESAENIDVYIACGDITGSPTDGELVIQLRPLNDSGYEGNAILVDNGDGTTTVTVQVYQTAEDLIGSPAATPVT